MEYPIATTYRSSEPVALIFADTDQGGEAAVAAVTAAGGRVGAHLPFAEARTRLADQAQIGAFLLEIDHDHGSLLDTVLDRIDMVAARENIPLIVSIQPELIDTVSARINAPHAILLCRPDAADRVAALSCAWIGQSVSVHDIKTDMDSVRLRRLSDEVSRIARALASLSGSVDQSHGAGLAASLQARVNDAQNSFAAEPATLYPVTMPDAAEIRAMLRLRRLRENFFDPVLFADPAWDMLLDLMAARLENDQVAVSSLCIAAAVPPTTALRWIKAMTDHKLFERHADPTDGRRIFIRLSDNAANGMARYFVAAKRIGGLAV